MKTNLRHPAHHNVLTKQAKILSANKPNVAKCKINNFRSSKRRKRKENPGLKQYHSLNQLRQRRRNEALKFKMQILKFNLIQLLKERGLRMVNLSQRKFQTPSPSSKTPGLDQLHPRVPRSWKQKHKKRHPKNQTLPDGKIHPLQKILRKANQKLKPDRRCKVEKMCRLARLQLKATVARVNSQSRKN